MTPPIEYSITEETSTGQKAFSALCLRLAPLIDVIFLLLIFFFISSQFSIPESLLPLDLPAVNAEGLAHIVEPLGIYVFNSQNGCKIKLADKTIDINEKTTAEGLTSFVENLAATLKTQKRVLADPVLLIFADDVQWDYVAKIYNLLYGMGINDITFELKIED